MKIAIVDDLSSDVSKLFDMLVDELQRLGVYDYLIDTFMSGSEFLAAWNAGAYSIIFLDIFMGTDSGINIARHIRASDKGVSIVFVTTSNEFASQSYEVNASYYLHKPFDSFKISAMLNQINLSQISRKRFIELPDRDRLLLCDIMYTEKFHHCVTFNLCCNRQKRIRISHNAVEKLLSPHSEFCTVGQGSIINFEYVESLTPQGFLMKNQSLIPVPRRRYKDLKNIYTRYSFDRAVMEGIF